MASLVRGFVRGCTAWTIGYVLTLALVVAGVVEPEGGAIDGAARAFFDAHRVVFGDLVDPAVLVAVPVVVVGVTGYRAGRGVTAGLTGRLRSFVQSVRGTERNRVPRAIRAAVYVAGPYALVGTIVAIPVGEPVPETAVTTLLVGLLAAVPTAVVGALR